MCVAQHRVHTSTALFAALLTSDPFRARLRSEQLAPFDDSFLAAPFPTLVFGLDETGKRRSVRGFSAHDGADWLVWNGRVHGRMGFRRGGRDVSGLFLLLSLDCNY